MVPRRILALSALAIAGLAAAIVAVQGRALPAGQLQGLWVAVTMAAVGALLVAQAGTFASAARWYIALLAVGLLGAFAASVSRDRPGDALGLVASIAAALTCAAEVVRRSSRRANEPFAVSQRAVPSLRRLVRKIEAETRAVLGELPVAAEPVRGSLVERLAQLRRQAQYAAGWSDRLRIGAGDPVRRKLDALRGWLGA